MRIRFINARDREWTDLFLQRYHSQSGTASLHLGDDANGPMVTHISLEPVTADEVLQVKGKWRIKIAPNFDKLVAVVVGMILIRSH